MLDGKVNTAFTIDQRILDSAGNPVTSGITPTFTIYDQTAYTQQATGTLTHKINGIWASSAWTPTLVGLYDVCIDENTIPRHYYVTVLIGTSDDNSLATHILSLANKGQDVTLGSGAGQVTYENTLNYNGAPLQNTTIGVFNATTFVASNGARGTVIDYTTEVSKQQTNTLGAYTFYLNPGYYALTFTDSNGGTNVFYINYNTNNATWTTSSIPINP